MASPTLSSTGREVTDSDLRFGLFTELDSRARKIEEAFKSSWVELGTTCIEMRNGEYWKEGHYTSFHSWLKSACPCSRSWAYLSMNAYEELQDVPEQELKQMPLANADVLRKLPKASRNAPETIQAAQSLTPAEFLPKMAAESRETALEIKFKLRYTVTASQHKVMHQFFDAWRLLHEETQSDAEIIECVMVDWMLTHQAELEAHVQS